MATARLLHEAAKYVLLQSTSVNAKRVAADYLKYNFADDDDLVTKGWLHSWRWTKDTVWPSTVTSAGQVLEWRGSSLWIGETPIARAETRGALRLVARALGVT